MEASHGGRHGYLERANEENIGALLAPKERHAQGEDAFYIERSQEEVLTTTLRAPLGLPASAQGEDCHALCRRKSYMAHHRAFPLLRA